MKIKKYLKFHHLVISAPSKAKLNIPLVSDNGESPVMTKAAGFSTPNPLTLKKCPGASNVQSALGRLAKPKGSGRFYIKSPRFFVQGISGNELFLRWHPR